MATPTFVIEGRATAPRTTAPAITNLPAVTKAVQPSVVAPIDPTQMQDAYGVNETYFGSTKGTGLGQTIAIVDAYNDPDIISDANSFSSQFGLQQFNVAGGPTLQVLNENGGTSLSGVPNSSPGGWDVEESLDVEWAHSIAPQANIILFEANSNSFGDLLTAEQTAAGTAGVSTVSNSWASGEFGGESEFDSYFTTPTGHQGVTFLASTGDSGTPAGYPAYSPNVVAVGGTSLDINSSGSYLGESAWSGSGGGISTQESQPSYQTGKVNGTSSTQRTAPDISIDADPNTGVYVLDSYYGGYLQVGGTSLACPMTAALISIADQGRVLNGLTTLDGPSQTLPALYDLSAANIHDITTGNNGYAAGVGYDLATGLGSPIANDLVPALAGYQTSQPATVTAPLTASLNENGSFTFAGSSITATDAAATGTSDSLSLSVIDGTLKLGSTAGLSFNSGANNASSMTVTGTLVNLDAALSGLVYTPTASYSGGDFLQVSVADANDHQTGWASVNITVNTVSAPAVTAPTAVSLTENQTYNFSSAISITDAAASGTSDSVSISVVHGTLTLGSTTGITFTQGLDASSSVTFSGTLANLNAALNGLVYTPASNYIGSDSLPISVKDSGDSLTGTATVSITVTSPAPPTIGAPSTASLAENATFAFSGGNAISVTDTSGTAEQLTLTAAHGTLSLGTSTGLTVTGNGSSSVVASGSLSSLNADLSSLTYTPNSNYIGSDGLSLTDKDTANSLTGTGSVAITVYGPPAITAPATLNADESAALAISGANAISISDAGGTAEQLTLSVLNGTLSLSTATGLTVTGNGTSSVVATGSLSSLNTDLGSLTYTPTSNYVGSDTLSISDENTGDSLTGTASTAITVLPWATMKNPVPNSDGAGLTLLLPNGTLMVKGGGDSDTSAWYEVTPDSTGSYLNGTWTQVASMNVSRLFFGSDVLPDGDVFVVGGQYASDQANSNSAEIYNPTTNVWTKVASDPESHVGNEPTEVLPNGDILVGDLNDNFTESYNPSTNTWTQNSIKVYGFSDQGPWAKLPNGDILAYDAASSISDNQGEAEIYNTSQNQPLNIWYNASFGTVPILSGTSEQSDVGPELLLPDGRVFVGGANGLTAYYNSATGIWSQGPTMPKVLINGVSTQLTMGNAAGAVMPDGDLLLALSPAVNYSVSPGPTYIYDFNPTTGVYTNVTPPSSSGFDTSKNSFVDNMLVLPTGQVLITNFEGDPIIYTPQGAPNAAWKPTITGFTNNGNGSYTLTGTQLNGLDEGAADGDNNQMAENYPLVQVTDTVTGKVYYATTSNWSSVGVATGSTPETVDVVLPAALGNDPFSLVVIANGIASSSFASLAVTAPTSATVAPNGSATFSSATANSIALADTSATAASDSLTLVVTHGTLTLASTAGLTFDNGTTNNSASVTVTGTLASLNAALSGLVYTPTASYSGSDSLAISLSDSGTSSTASASVAIKIGNPPVITAPATFSVNSESGISLSGTDAISITDSQGTAEQLTLSVAHGSLELGTTTGLTVTGNYSSSMVLTGPLSTLNSDLTSLIYYTSAYVPYVGADTLTLSDKDTANNQTGTASVSITVNAVAPTIGFPPILYINPGQTLAFTGGNAIHVTDVFGSSEEFFIWGFRGTFSLGTTTGLTVTGDGTAFLSLSGTLSNLDNDLTSLTYTAGSNFVLDDEINIYDTDTGDNLTQRAVFAIYKTYPTVTAPSTGSVNENSTLLFSSGSGNAITLSDLWASGNSDTLSLSVGNGSLTLATTNGLTFQNGTTNDSDTITVTGTMAALNAAVNGLIYAPSSGYSGPDSLEISLNDTADNENAYGIVSITVNYEPSPTVTAPTNISLNENSSFTFSGGSIGLADPAASGTSDSLSLSVTDGKLTLGSTTGLTFNSGANGSSSMTVTGTLANLNAAVNDLVYTPNSGYAGSDSLQMSLKDTADNLSGSASVAITVIAAPSVSAPAAIGVNENTSYTFSAGSISLTDVAATSTSESLLLSVSDGTLTLGSTTGLTINPGSNGSSSMTVTGTLANLNAALNGLVYTPGSNYLGGDSLQISLKDSGDGLSGSAAVAITVSKLAPPSITAPATASTNENSSLTFSNSAISLTDAAASGTSDSLTLVVTNGKLTLASTTGITLTSGAYGSSSMTINGTLANLNAALNGLIYSPTTGFSGHDSLQISVTDSMDSLTGSAAVAISVNPFVTAPASINVLENNSFTFSSSSSPITLTDGAASGSSDSMTLTDLHGKLTLASLTGLTIVSGSNGSSSITVKGTLANLNAALNGLVYAPTSGYIGPDTLTITVADSGDNLFGSASVAITVQQRKVLSGVSISNDTTTESDDQTNQWAGVTAAVDVLNA